MAGYVGQFSLRILSIVFYYYFNINDFVDYDEQFTARDVFMWGLYKICFQEDHIYE